MARRRCEWNNKRKSFKYEKKGNYYICPNGKVLKFMGKVKLNRNEENKYQSRTADCKGCPYADKCMHQKRNKASSGHYIFPMDADNRTGICGYYVLQGDNAVYITEPEESKYSMAVILPCTQHRQVQCGGEGEKGGIGKEYRANKNICRKETGKK